MRPESGQTGGRASGARSRGIAGFSLLELLLTIALVGILTALGIFFSPRGRLEAREAARIIAADLNRARSEAIRLNTFVAFDFANAACDGYCIYTDPVRQGSPDGALAPDYTLSQPVLLERAIEDQFPRMSIASASFASAPRLWFDVRGLPRTSGGTFLGSSGSVLIRPASGGTGFLVTVEPQGRVLVESE